jgi:hypothetical protein
VAQNISVEIRPCHGVEIGVLNEYPITDVPGGLQVALGDAYDGERRRVVAALHLPAPPAVGPVQLGELIVRWASTIGDVALHTVTIPVMINASDDAANVAADPEVTEHVNVLRAAKARKAAHESLLRGDSDAARSALSDAISLLAPLPSQAAELAQAKFDLDELDQGSWTDASTKRLHSTMRSTQKGRPSRFDKGQS